MPAVPRLAVLLLTAGLAGAGTARAVVILETTWQAEGGRAGDEPDGFAAHAALAHQPQFRALIAFSNDDGEAWTSCSGT
ncbi:MAG: hypothetical protein LCH95_15970 [Proteobacteria bacterium]|nr:hypothetical protein [Pseudomonadota bacterium]